MMLESNSKPHSLTPVTIFAPESRKTKKTLLKILYSSRTYCNPPLILAPVCTCEWNNSKHISALFKVI